MIFFKKKETCYVFLKKNVRLKVKKNNSAFFAIHKNIDWHIGRKYEKGSC